MAVRETISVHTIWDITLDALWPNASRHAPLPAHATSSLCVSSRPVFIVACVQCADVARNEDCSTYRPGWSWLLPSSSQHLTDKSEPQICVKFSSQYKKIKGCNSCERSGLTGGKRPSWSTPSPLMSYLLLRYGLLSGGAISAVLPYSGTYPCHFQPVESQTLYNLMPKFLRLFFGMFGLKITLPLNFTMNLSNACVCVCLYIYIYIERERERERERVAAAYYNRG